MHGICACYYRSISFGSADVCVCVWRAARQPFWTKTQYKRRCCSITVFHPFLCRLLARRTFFFFHSFFSVYFSSSLAWFFHHILDGVIIAIAFAVVCMSLTRCQGMTNGLLVYCVKMWWQDDDMISSLTCNILMVFVCGWRLSCWIAGSDVSWIKLSFFNLSD